MKQYMDLTDIQIDNLLKILDKANSPQLNILKETYQSLKSGINNREYRDNVAHALMTGDINFNYFTEWATQLFINTCNTIYVYDIDKKTNLKQLQTKKVQDILTKKIRFIFDINYQNINKFELVGIKKLSNENQLIFSFISPCQIIKNKNNNQITIEDDMFFSYVWLDLSLNKLIISVPPHPNHHSINGHKIKKTDTDKIANIILTNFQKEIFKIEFSLQNWILPVLNEINNEYFHHNNPIITKKMNLLDTKLSLALKLFERFDRLIINDTSKKRIEKNIKDLIESEMILTYGQINKELPFSIFLQELDKGMTQYRANNGGNAFSFSESRDILKKLIDNAHISAIGIMYSYNGKEIAYKIYKSNYFFALKRTSTATTEKEIVDSVLFELNKYKQRIGFGDHGSNASENK